MRCILVFCLMLLATLAYSALNNQQVNTTPCATCHGSNGQSLNPEWPHLAGQQKAYLKKQLIDLKTGDTRHADAAMRPFILNLTTEEITALANFYAKQAPPVGSHHLRRKNQTGEALYQTGDPNKQIMPCIACHGTDAKGNAAAGFPSLRGQQIGYITHQLQAFKNGERANDPTQTMQRITENMTDEDIYSLAYYLASLSK